MESAVNFDLAHVLFMDVIGFSKLLIDEQHEVMDELNAVVRATAQFRSADENGKLISLPTGDGMALAFLERSDAPVRCAVEVARALKSHPQIQLRMGIHSGAVRGVTDVNQRANLAGAGINTAQRVMDCGAAGHILLSQRVAEDLSQFREWASSIHDLGECEVKHGDRIRMYSLVGDGFGSPNLPQKISANKPAPIAVKRSTVGRKGFAAAAAAAFVAALATTWWIAEHRSPIHGKTASVPATVIDTPEKSIAVLPLENLSDDKKDAFFADGVQDDILTSLAQIADLKVISRTSVMQYRGASRSLRDIGKALGVANILEGSVRREGNRVLVNVQLIDAQHDRHLWAQRYDRTLTDSIGLQGELATEIANALKAKLAPEEKSRLATKPTANGEAYLLYLQANQLVHVAASRREVFEADALYSQAMALDPKFALAYAHASMLNSLMYQVGRDPARMTRARALLEEALRLSPDLGEVHLAAGLCYFRIDRKYDAALKELAIASAASPNDSQILDASGLVYSRQGRWREAIAIFQKAQVLDPRQAHFHGAPDTLLAMRQWSAANAAYERGLQLEPQLVDGWVGLAYVQFAQSGVASAGSTAMAHAPEVVKTKGDAEDAQWDYAMMARDFAAAKNISPDRPENEFPAFEPKAYYDACTAYAQSDIEGARHLLEPVVVLHEAGLRGHPDDPRFHATLGRVYAMLGRKEDAIREARRAVELLPESSDAVAGPVYAADLAFVYAQCGEVDQAVTLLSRLLTTPSAVRITLAHLRLSWEWDPLRADQRFKSLIAGPEPTTVY